MSPRPPDKDAPEQDEAANAVEGGSELPPDSPAAPDPDPHVDDAGAPGGLTDDAAALLSAATKALGSYATHFRALKILFLEEFALARDSIVASLVFLMVSMVMLATAYALLTALVVLGLRWAGLPLALAILLPLLASAGFAWFAFMRARALFRYADFEATRRQFDRGLTVPKEAETEE